MKIKYIVFDLDDTLVGEIEYLKSAYKFIASSLDHMRSEDLYDDMLQRYLSKQDVFEYLSECYGVPKQELLTAYRNHFPNIQLIAGARDLLLTLKQMGHRIGLVSDGRSVTQRNKLKALKIEELFDRIVISEEFGSAKPNMGNFEVFQERGIEDYFYIGDNPTKDFLAPNKLGWTTVCLLDQGHNIHPQDFTLGIEFQPQYKIRAIEEVLDVISV